VSCVWYQFIEQTNEERKMQTGKVRMWSARGFGFLTPDDGTGDLFIHISSCVDGIDELRVGQRVSYNEKESRRKPGSAEAVDVQVI
jgi:cold shock protein